MITLRMRAQVTDQGANRTVELKPGNEAQEAGVYQVKDGFTVVLTSDHPDYNTYSNGGTYTVQVS